MCDHTPTVTTIDPLNLALTAKSLKGRIWWWFFTVVAVVACVSSVTLLVNTYSKRATRVVIKMTINRLPFPAVTFCNMNPYKKSAIASIPEVAQLIEAYTKASQTQNHTVLSEIENKSNKRKRRKRDNPLPSSCSCVFTNSKSCPSKNDLSLTYVLYPDTMVTWNCSFTCCNQPASGVSSISPGTIGQLARINSLDLGIYLRSKGLIGTNKVWVPAYGNSVGTYYWYNDSTTQSTGIPINISDFQGKCTTFDAGGPVFSYSGGFCNPSPDATSTIICEYQTSTLTTTTIAAFKNTVIPNTTTATTAETSLGLSLTSASNFQSSVTSTSIQIESAASSFPASTSSSVGIVQQTPSCQKVCDYSSPVRASNSSISASTFVRYPKTNVSWPCSFECCKSSPEGSDGRPAQIDSDPLLLYLKNNGVILVDGLEAWIGMASNEKSVDEYLWYDTPQQTRTAVDWTCFCQDITSCYKPYSNNQNQAVLVYAHSSVIFDKRDVIETKAVICEFNHAASSKPSDMCATSILTSEKSTVARKTTTTTILTTEASTPLLSTSTKTIDTISSISTSSSATATPKVQTSLKPASCTNKCNYADPVLAHNSSLSASTFVLYPGASVYWECSFQCCKNASYGSGGRPAQINSDSLVLFLKNNNVISNKEAWIGMSALIYPTLQYHWYDTFTSPNTLVDWTSLCTNNMTCVIREDTENSGPLPVTVNYDVSTSKNVFHRQPSGSYTYGVICEFPGNNTIISTATTGTTALATPTFSSTKLTTDPATKGTLEATSPENTLALATINATTTFSTLPKSVSSSPSTLPMFSDNTAAEMTTAAETSIVTSSTLVSASATTVGTEGFSQSFASTGSNTVAPLTSNAFTPEVPTAKLATTTPSIIETTKAILSTLTSVVSEESLSTLTLEDASIVSELTKTEQITTGKLSLPESYSSTLSTLASEGTISSTIQRFLTTLKRDTSALAESTITSKINDLSTFLLAAYASTLDTSVTSVNNVGKLSTSTALPSVAESTMTVSFPASSVSPTSAEDSSVITTLATKSKLTTEEPLSSTGRSTIGDSALIPNTPDEMTSITNLVSSAVPDVTFTISVTADTKPLSSTILTTGFISTPAITTGLPTSYYKFFDTTSSKALDQTSLAASSEWPHETTIVSAQMSSTVGNNDITVASTKFLDNSVISTTLSYSVLSEAATSTSDEIMSDSTEKTSKISLGLTASTNSLPGFSSNEMLTTKTTITENNKMFTTSATHIAMSSTAEQASTSFLDSLYSTKYLPYNVLSEAATSTTNDITLDSTEKASTIMFSTLTTSTDTPTKATDTNLLTSFSSNDMSNSSTTIKNTEMIITDLTSIIVSATAQVSTLSADDTTSNSVISDYSASNLLTTLINSDTTSTGSDLTLLLSADVTTSLYSKSIADNSLNPTSSDAPTDLSTPSQPLSLIANTIGTPAQTKTDLTVQTDSIPFLTGTANPILNQALILQLTFPPYNFPDLNIPAVSFNFSWPDFGNSVNQGSNRPSIPGQVPAVPAFGTPSPIPVPVTNIPDYQLATEKNSHITNLLSISNSNFSNTQVLSNSEVLSSQAENQSPLQSLISSVTPDYLASEASHSSSKQENVVVATSTENENPRNMQETTAIPLITLLQQTISTSEMLNQVANLGPTDITSETATDAKSDSSNQIYNGISNVPTNLNDLESKSTNAFDEEILNISNAPNEQLLLTSDAPINEQSTSGYLQILDAAGTSANFAQSERNNKPTSAQISTTAALEALSVPISQVNSFNDRISTLAEAFATYETSTYVDVTSDTTTQTNVVLSVADWIVTNESKTTLTQLSDDTNATSTLQSLQNFTDSVGLLPFPETEVSTSDAKKRQNAVTNHQDSSLDNSIAISTTLLYLNNDIIINSPVATVTEDKTVFAFSNAPSTLPEKETSTFSMGDLLQKYQSKQLTTLQVQSTVHNESSNVTPISSELNTNSDAFTPENLLENNLSITISDDSRNGNAKSALLLETNSLVDSLATSTLATTNLLLENLSPNLILLNQTADLTTIISLPIINSNLTNSLNNFSDTMGKATNSFANTSTVSSIVLSENSSINNAESIATFENYTDRKTEDESLTSESETASDPSTGESRNINLATDPVVINSSSQDHLSTSDFLATNVKPLNSTIINFSYLRSNVTLSADYRQIDATSAKTDTFTPNSNAAAKDETSDAFENFSSNFFQQPLTTSANDLEIKAFALVSSKMQNNSNTFISNTSDNSKATGTVVISPSGLTLAPTLPDDPNQRQSTTMSKNNSTEHILSKLPQTVTVGNVDDENQNQTAVTELDKTFASTIPNNVDVVSSSLFFGQTVALPASNTTDRQQNLNLSLQTVSTFEKSTLNVSTQPQAITGSQLNVSDSLVDNTLTNNNAAVTISNKAATDQSKNALVTMTSFSKQDLLQEIPANLTEAIKQFDSVKTALDSVKSDPASLSTTSQDILPYIVASLPLDLAVKAGYKLSDLILRCVYNGVKCSDSDFNLQVDPNYGNCYTFNAKGANAIAKQAGFGKGLSVTYSVGENDYLDFVEAAGVRVLIHGQNETVFPDALGYNMPGGYQTTATIKQIILSAISESCVKSASDVPMFNYMNVSYSREGCLRSCYQQTVIERCQCGDPRVPLPPDSKVGHCDVAKRDCVNTYFAVDNSSNNQCNCPPECRTNVYDTTLSATKWSSFHEHQISQISDDNANRSSKNQFAKIDVYFDNLVIMEYIEAPAYDIFGVLWDISAVSGLFLGISILSLFEIIVVVEYLWKSMP